MVDYSQSLILTSFEHVNTFQEVASRKEQIQLKKEEKARMRELTKAERAVEKVRNMAAKSARAATKEAKKKLSEKWTKDAIEELGTKLHESIKKEVQFKPSFLLWYIAMEMQVEPGGFHFETESKKKKKGRGIHVPKFPFPLQPPWFHGVQQRLLEQGVPQRLLSAQAIPPWIFLHEPPRRSILTISAQA